FEVVQGKVQLPRTLGVNKEHDNIPVTISIIGFLDPASDLDDNRDDCPDDPAQPSGFAVNPNFKPQAKVVRRSIQTYRDNHIAFVPMPLRFSCFDNLCNGSADTVATQTCKGGTCVDATIDSASLPDYNDDLVYGNTNTCFSNLRCLANAQQPTLLDATNCLYSATGPAGPDPADLNVRVIYDGFVSETLDDDRDEGFFVPDATKPDQFQLAPGLCQATKSGATHPILSIGASRGCPTKTALQPLCNEGAQVLIPSPSALYLMLDRSQAMQPLITQPQGVSQVLGLTLQDAALATTNIGFKFIPAISGACTQATYANLAADPTDLEFEVATKGQADIASRITAQHTGTFPATAPPFPEILDATGAYASFSGNGLDQTAAYNRRAVILITNNDVNASNGCSGSGPSATSAGAALSGASPIYTYVILLKNSGDPNPTQTLQNATDLATAGGTTVFDATGADAGPAALNAINSIIADLSSCLYETPTNITDESAALAISSPLGTQNIPFNAACSPTSASSDGWNFDGSRIRICGGSCTTIRSVLTSTANGANATAQSAPQVVVTASQPQ
ncbi:MAG: hypothetical protein ACREJX_05190, partial [Polyangiaceae bacterium]